MYDVEKLFSVFFFGMTETDIRQGSCQSWTQTEQMDSLNADKRESL